MNTIRKSFYFPSTGFREIGLLSKEQEAVKIEHPRNTSLHPVCTCNFITCNCEDTNVDGASGIDEVS